ncbi:MAG: ASCH domain-containing protein [Chloroflexota bacterium]
MKALSIRQPWAWLIANGYKDVENRTWPTKFRGRVYIHAGLKGDWSAWGFIREQMREGYTGAMTGAAVLGAIIGEVDIVGCVTESDSPWFEGPYGFVLANPVAYETPIPYKGHLGFFEVLLP